MAVRLRVVLTVFLLVALVVVVSAAVTFWFGNRVLRAHQREQIRRDGIRALSQLESVLKDAETGQRGFVITGDESYLQPFNVASQVLPERLAELSSYPWVDLNADEIEQVEHVIEQKMAEMRTTIDARRNSGFEAAAAIVRQGSGKQLMDQLRSDVTRMQEKQLAALKQDVQSSDRLTRTRTAAFLITAIINVSVLAWAYRRIAEALKQRDSALRESNWRGYELQRQKDLLSVTLSSIGDCVMVTNTEAQITFMNPTAEALTGWKENEAIGRPITEVFRIINEHTRQPVENPVDKVMKHGVIVGLANHTLLIRKDGSEVPIDDSGAPIRGAKGEIRGAVLVFRDFSEHKTAERELRVAKEAAETANKAKDQFLAMLSHELRTPLTPVLATLNLWEASEDVPSSLHADVQMLRRSIELEARIIDDLLDLTRIARGLLSFSAEITDIHALIEFLIGLSQSELQNKNLKVRLDLKAERNHVFTDAARLQQVLWNVVRNAMKFTENGGELTIATTNDGDKNIDIAVTDTGIGMTPDTMARLFTPFEQADRSLNRRYGGLGLGMAISSALVDLLDGKIRAESPGLGQGSTFTVTFPTVDGAAQSGATGQTSPTKRGKMHLLLVEDHVETARALTRLLEHRGYQVNSAATIAAGLESLNHNQFDVVICDLGLPDGTGIELIEKVRQTSQIPAIALTGFGMQEDVERALRAGFDVHLTKPVNVQKLESTMWAITEKLKN